MRQRILYTMALLFATLQTFAQTYTYDNLNRLTKVVYDNGTTITYTYDALGNRLSKTVTGATSETYTITTAVSPSGSGTVTGGGTYAKGTTVELNAIANAGYEFSKWSDGDTANPRTITVTGNKSYTAQFVAITDIEGDVNSDGVVGIGDIVAVTNVMAGIANDAAISKRADVNYDGQVGIGDIVAITNIMAGITIGGTNVTDLVDLDSDAWGGSGMVDWAAPEVTTSDGRTTPLAERYVETVYNTGIVLEQTVTGLTNGTYKVELYANAFYTDGRGFSSDVEEGQMDVVYIFANDTKKYIPVHIGTEMSASDEYELTAYVIDGTLHLGMYAEKPGTNWHTIQIKSLRRVGNLESDDVTNNVSLDEGAWGGSGMVGWAAPEVTTSDGRTTAMAELYVEPAYFTGTVLEQTVSGLPNGTYKVELYANAYFTDGRGFSSDATEGQMDMVYLFANDTKLYIPVHIGTEFSVSDEYTLTAKVTDGTLHMGMYSEKEGTNWWTIQIKSLSRTGN